MDLYNGRRFDGRRSSYGYNPGRRPVTGNSCSIQQPGPARQSQPQCGCTGQPLRQAVNRAPSHTIQRNDQGRMNSPMARGAENGCGCNTPSPVRRERHEFPSDFYPVGMAYVPTQTWGETYELCKGFQSGTIFPVLDKPFMAGRCARR